MNRIEQLFQKKTQDILSVYFTAGYPGIDSTIEVLNALQEGGADLVEVGIPFSDPLADGPVIQQSNKKALENGITVDYLFEQLAGFRKEIKLPVIIMGYLNPIYKYGIEKFIKRCKDTGIDGVIIPDLPVEVYLSDYRNIFEKNHFPAIFLITPVTSEQRIRLIDDISGGFIYMVSSASTTGVKAGITGEQKEYFGRVASLQLKNPVLIGFGISNHKGFSEACRYASGAITGSAFIKALENSRDIKNDTIRFIRSLRGNSSRTV